MICNFWSPDNYEIDTVLNYDFYESIRNLNIICLEVSSSVCVCLCARTSPMKMGSNGIVSASTKHRVDSNGNFIRKEKQKQIHCAPTFV